MRFFYTAQLPDDNDKAQLQWAVPVDVPERTPPARGEVGLATQAARPSWCVRRAIVDRAVAFIRSLNLSL